MLRVIVLLEYGSQFPGSSQFEILESSEIVVIEDLDIIRPTHDPINLMKPAHALSSNASPHHQVSRTMLDILLGKSRVQSLPRLNPAILAAIRLEKHEFGLIREYDSLPVLHSPPNMLHCPQPSLLLIGWGNVGFGPSNTT